MPLSMHQASAPVFLRQLNALSAILAKAEAHVATHGIDEAELTTARLAPDMLPLTAQVQIATDTAKGAMARLGGVDNPSFADGETTLAELSERIARATVFIDSVPADLVDGSEEREIVLKIGGQEMPFRGQDYLLHFALPNFFFHVTTTHDLLRHKGVEIGKRDFLGNA